MTLTMRPMLEADVEQALRVQYAAFRRPGIGLLLSPAPEPSVESIEELSRHRLEAMRTNKAARFMVVHDTERAPASAIIACAHWDLFPDERTEEQVEKLCHKPSPPPDANADAWVDFFGHFAESRRALGTKPVAVLHTLVTHPEHQRRGAGALLMQTFIQQVDDAGIEAYLEASEAGKPLYTRFGFQPALEKTFDLSKYGADGVEVNTVMLRPPKSKASA